MARVAMLSFHTSPLAKLGVGDGGGMNVYIKELAERLAPVGVRVDVYTASDEARPDVIDLKSGLRVRHISLRGGDLSERLAEFTDIAGNHIQKTGADLLHAHYWTSGVVGHALKHQLGLPLVSTFHTLSRVKQQAGINETNTWRAEAEDRIIGCSDAVIANDNSEAADMLRLYGADSDKVYVVPPGVDDSHFAPKDRSIARSMVGLPANRPIILFVGRIQPIKGIDVAIETVAKLRRLYPDILLAIVGGPSGSDGEAALRAARTRITQEALEDNVRFVGAQPRDVMAQWYSAADVCMVPSRSESFGLVALEASACGTPVVASDVGALPNVVNDNRSGYLVPMGDVEGFVRSIAKVLDNSITSAALSAAAVQRAGRFSWDSTVNRTYCLYNKVMDARFLAGRQEPCVSA